MPEESSTGSTVPLNLLLDIDGTLAITDRLYLLAFQDLMRPFGYTDVDEAWFEKHVAGKVDVDVFRALLPADSTTEMLEATSRKKDALFVQKAATEGAASCRGCARCCRWRGAESKTATQRLARPPALARSAHARARARRPPASPSLGRWAHMLWADRPYRRCFSHRRGGVANPNPTPNPNPNP